MILFLQCLFTVAAFLTLCLLVGMEIAYWIARGESDVNGDPERDAGLLPPRKPRVVCAWCHPHSNPGSDPISHGICAAHRAEMEQSIGPLKNLKPQT